MQGLSSWVHRFKTGREGVANFVPDLYGRGWLTEESSRYVHSTHVVQGHILRYFLAITRLLVDELALLPGILKQWTDFELSQFVVPVTCPKFVPPIHTLFFFAYSSRLFKFSLADVPNQTYLNCSTTTGPRSSSARMDASAPGAVTARGEWTFRCRMIVGMRRWMSWQGRGDGCAALDPVRFVQTPVFSSWSNTGALRLQSCGGEEYRMRSYHLSVWNVSQSIGPFCTRKRIADICS